MNQPSTLNLSQIQEKVLSRAIALLDAINCSYAIVDPVGNKHGLLETKRSQSRQYPHGERSNYVRQYVSKLGVGERADVPFDKYNPFQIQSSSANLARDLWGKSSLVTTIDRSKSIVQIIRVH